MKYKVGETNSFKKDLRDISKRGYDLSKLSNVVKIIANGENLDVKYKDHKLQNSKQYKDCRECHIEPDWLLVYKINNDKLLLVLTRTGTHSDLF